VQIAQDHYQSAAIVIRDSLRIFKFRSPAKNAILANSQGPKEFLIRIPEVACVLVRRDVPLISKKEEDFPPIDRGVHQISVKNERRRSARESDCECASITDRFFCDSHELSGSV
jgi:hypothetical protein